VCKPYRTGAALSLGLLLGVALFAPGACRRGALPDPATGPNKEAPYPEEPTPALFRDVTTTTGVEFRYRNGEEADRYSILETVGGGVGLLDYDGDGLLDVFVCGGGYFEGSELRGYPNRLYKNLGGWRFRDVTAEAGLDGPLFYSHGCAVADYDRDGWPDLLVTGYGRLALYHNVPDGRGGRRFEEVSRPTGLLDSDWSTSAAWADLDGDGYPDLYICHYLNWSPANNPPCAGPRPDIPREVCTPHSFNAQPHRLYHNNGDGTFRDVSKEAGLRQHTADDGKGLGVVVVDVNGDGRPDLFVANDSTDRFLYINRGGGRFEEQGRSAGVARNDKGNVDGSMGVDAADYDGSGRPSLWVTNFQEQLHGLYRNDCIKGSERFTFETQLAGIARIGQAYVGFGTAFIDFDNDGWEDLVISNGHVFRHPVGSDVRQLPVLLKNVEHPRKPGQRWFNPIRQQGGPYFQTGHRGRGLAVGDLDNDGYPDLIISHVNEPVTLLRNESAAGNHWLGVELLGEGHGDPTGAKATLVVGGRTLVRFAKGGGSYLSASDRRLLFGLGKNPRPGRLTLVWASGRTEHWDGMEADRYHRLEEGSGVLDRGGAD
jgi:enediyne biosynthesis protein E4